MRRIAILGVGKLGEAIAEGLLSSGTAGVLYLVERSEERRQEAARKYRATVTVDPVPACKFSEAIILAVKPGDLLELCRSIAPSLNERQVVISAAAGVTLPRIREALGGHAKVARVMPNLAARMNAAVTGVFSEDEAARATATELFSDLGICIQCADEHEVNQLTALSASGPAFVAEFLEGLQIAAEALGMKHSREVVLKMAVGTVQVLAAGKESPGEFVQRVKTPGGTTAAGLEKFERAGMRETLKEALEAAVRRAGELDKEIA